MKFIQNKPIKNVATYLFTLFILSISSGCFQEYYKIVQPNRQNFREVVKKDLDKRYFVLYHRGEVRQLQDPVFQGETLQGFLSDLPAERANFVFLNRPTYLVDTIPVGSIKKNRRYFPDEKFIIQAVHVYLKDTAQVTLESESVLIPMSEIQEVHVYAKDQGSTFVSHVMPVIAVGGAVFVIKGVKSISFFSFNNLTLIR